MEETPRPWISTPFPFKQMKITSTVIYQRGNLHFYDTLRRNIDDAMPYDGVVKSLLFFPPDKRVWKGKDLSCEKVNKKVTRSGGAPGTSGERLTYSYLPVFRHASFSLQCRLFDIMSHQKRTLFFRRVDRKTRKRNKIRPFKFVFFWPKRKAFD